MFMFIYVSYTKHTFYIFAKAIDQTILAQNFVLNIVNIDA